MIRILIVCVCLSNWGGSVALGQEGNKSPTSDKLPKVVLVGDSIRLSYAPIVAKELEGKALIISPKPNGGDSSNVLKNLKAWVIAEEPDVVHFNCGIHDTKKFHATGKFQVSPEAYEANLRKIVEQIRAETDAVVLFASTTPILDKEAAALRKDRDYALLEASVEQYNQIAGEVMTELKVLVDDLHGLLSNPPAPHTTATLISNDGVHLVPAARELVGKQVAAFVQKHLPKQTK